MHYTRTSLVRTRRPSKHGILLWLVILAMDISGRRLSAMPVRPLDVAALTAGADVIVVGEITNVSEAGPTTVNFPAGSMSATLFRGSLRLDKIIKGAPGAGSLSFEFALPDAAVAVGSLRPGQAGMFFLKATGRHWEFFDANHPSLPCLPAVANIPTPVGDPLQDVTEVLGQVLGCASCSDSDRAQALDALGEVNTELSKRIMRGVLKSSSGDFHLNVARTLVAHDDVAGLQPIEEALSHPGSLSQVVLANLAGSLSGLKDPRAIPILARLIRNGNPNIRRNAAIALRHTSSRDALGPLSELLSDGDPTVRYCAVAGLGEITQQNDWAPAFDEFKQHEQKYLAYWRNWAQASLR